MDQARSRRSSADYLVWATVTFIAMIVVVGVFKVGELYGQFRATAALGEQWALEHKQAIIGKSPAEVVDLFALMRFETKRSDGSIEEIIFCGPGRHYLTVRFGADGRAAEVGHGMGG